MNELEMVYIPRDCYGRLCEYAKRVDLLPLRLISPTGKQYLRFKMTLDERDKLAQVIESDLIDEVLEHDARKHAETLIEAIRLKPQPAS